MRQKSPENGLWTKTLQSPENAGCRLQTLAPHLFINPQVDWKNQEDSGKADFTVSRRWVNMNGLWMKPASPFSPARLIAFDESYPLENITGKSGARALICPRASSPPITGMVESKMTSANSSLWSRTACTPNFPLAAVRIR